MRNLIPSTTSSRVHVEPKRHITLWWLAIVFILFSSACATVGKDFSEGQVPAIEIGETNQADIQAMFGPPWRVGIEDGKTTWTYGRYRYNLFSPDTAKDLVIRFNDRGVVTSYSYNTTEQSQ